MLGMRHWNMPESWHKKMNIHLWRCYFEGFSGQIFVRRPSLTLYLNKNQEKNQKPSLSLLLNVDADTFLSRVHPWRDHLHRHPRNDRALPSLRFHKSIEGKNVWNAGILFGHVLSFPLLKCSFCSLWLQNVLNFYWDFRGRKAHIDMKSWKTIACLQQLDTEDFWAMTAS